MATTPTAMSIILLPRFNMMGLTSIVEPMRVANYLSPEELYRWDYRCVEAGDVTASNGLPVSCSVLDPPDGPTPDIITVCGSWGAEHYQRKELFNWLRRQERRGAQFIGVELGVYALARAGLLNGRIATTHWSWKPGFEERFPQIEVLEQLYTIDRNVMTCGGVTTGVDLMFQVIAKKHGDRLVAEIANQMLHYPQRPADGPQRYATRGIDHEFHRVVRDAMSLIETNIEEPVSVPVIAKKLGISQRQLERLFKQDVGCTVVQFSNLLRLQYARVLLTSTRMSIREVSAAAGFNSMSYFSLSFAKTFGKKPSEYRQTWPENEAAPSWPGTIYSYNLDLSLRDQLKR